MAANKKMFGEPGNNQPTQKDAEISVDGKDASLIQAPLSELTFTKKRETFGLT